MYKETQSPKGLLSSATHVLPLSAIPLYMYINTICGK